MTDSGTELLDLERILASKFKGKKFPKWFVRALSRFFHIDFLNSLLLTSEGREGVAFCTHCVNSLGLKLEVSGLENIPDDGTLYTFASNHPLGGADGVVLCSLIGERFGGVQMSVNDFLMNIKPLAPICVPINKFGSQLRNLPALLDESFGSKDQILIFPAGLCSRKTGGRIQDRDWAKTFVAKSVQNGRSIVPVHFIGRNSNRFYRLTNLAKALHIKFNIGMLCLPDEFYRSKGSTYRIVFGKPLPPSYFDSSKSAKEWAAWLRQEAYNLQ